MRHPTRGNGGFSLLEVMVASSISLIVLAAALWSAAELQRRGVLEESVMGAQNAMRAVRDLLVIELQRAGTGAGSARLVAGTRAGVTDVQYAITLGTAETFDGTGLFPPDSNFARPTGPYASRLSDAIQAWSWDTEAQDATGAAIPLLSLDLCPAAAGAPALYRNGNVLCPRANPSALRNRLVMVVKPATRTSCLMQVADVDTSTTPPQVTVIPGVPGNPPPPGDVCATPPVAPSSDYTRFWSRDSTGAFIVPVRGVSFRINWKSGGPVLERLERTSDLTQAATWVALTQDVERLRVRLGVTSNLAQLNAELLWFPSTSPVRPAIDTCGAACDALVPVAGWAPSPDEPTSRDALMRRVRMVELTITTRTSRADPSMIRKDGSGFFLDADGNPQDGYKRRTTTVELMPRNFAYAGVTP